MNLRQSFIKLVTEQLANYTRLVARLRELMGDLS